jgi:hypothetical protein
MVRSTTGVPNGWNAESPEHRTADRAPLAARHLNVAEPMVD